MSYNRYSLYGSDDDMDVDGEIDEMLSLIHI